MKNEKQKNNNQLLMKSYTSSLLKGKKSDDIIDLELYNVECEFLNQ